MKIRYSEKDRLTEDLKTFDHEMEKIQLEKKETIKMVFLFLLSLTYYVSNELDLNFITSVFNDLVGLILVVSFIGMLVYPWSRRDQKHSRKVSIENFISKWGHHPSSFQIRHEKKEFIFEDRDRIPWDHIEMEILFEVTNEKDFVEIELQPKNRMVWVKMSDQKIRSFFNLDFVHVTFKLNDEGILKNHLIRLRESFQFSTLNDLTRERIITKIRSIFPDVFVQNTNSEGMVLGGNNHPQGLTKDLSGSVMIYEDTEGPEKRWVYLKRQKGNLWRIHEYNLGPMGLKMFGKEENEWWIDIEDKNLLNLFSTILEHSFSDSNSKVPMELSSLKTVLASKSIPFESGTW